MLCPCGAPCAGPPPRPAPTDWGAMAAFLDSGGKASSSSVAAAAVQGSSWPADTSTSGDNNSPNGIISNSDAADTADAAEAQRRSRFEAARNKMSDEYEEPDAEVVSVIQNATQVQFI